MPATPDRAAPAPAFVASCLFGALGLVMILVGVGTGADALFVLGAGAGAVSLGAALYWRSQLIAEHRSTNRPPR